MNLLIPPPSPPAEDPDDRQQIRARERFDREIWNLIMAYSGAVSVDEMRTALEETLLTYYDVSGDGTVGSA